MSVAWNNRGVSLLELIIAASMLIVAVVVISLTFPKANVSVNRNRQRLMATRFADSRMQEIKAQSYPYIVLTNQADFGAVPNCNCGAMDLSALPGTDATLEDGTITYTRKVCVNLVELVGPPGATTLTPRCPDVPLTSATDRGLKNIRVRVSWISGKDILSTDTETLVAR